MSFPTVTAGNDDAIKTCCAGVYESDFARLLLGNFMHPGGLALTERLGELLELTRASRVLDVAAGTGASALFLAERFGCEVVGIDYSGKNVEEAGRRSADRGLGVRVRFERGDAERLPFADGVFDAIVCECAFCLFPSKARAMAEFARVLRPGGRLGLSDLTRTPVLPAALESLLAWVACIGDARPVDEYTAYLQHAGLFVEGIESHDQALVALVHRLRGRLLGAEILAGLNKLRLPGADLAEARNMAREALAAIEARQLGYVVLIAAKPGGAPRPGGTH